MYVQVIDYNELCSNAFLGIVDNVELRKSEKDRYIIDLNDKVTTQLLKYYIKSFCKSTHQFGTKNIIFNSCAPFNNWRKEERGSAIRAAKYALTDPDSFEIDKGKLEQMLNKIWYKDLKQNKEFENFSFIELNTIDFFDFIIVLKHFFNKINLVPTHYYFLRDVNNEYMHTFDIPLYIRMHVEIELRKNKLIL